MHFQAGPADDFGKASDTGGLLTIDDYQPGDGAQIDVLGAGQGGEVAGMVGDEIAQPFFL